MRSSFSSGGDAAHGPLQTPYTGPYRVLERADKHFVIQCGERQESVSIDRLKAAKGDPERQMVPAVPPRRGRPPKQPADEAGPPSSTGDQESRKSEGPATSPPTYAQVTKRGRVSKPPERYAATIERDPIKTGYADAGGESCGGSVPQGVSSRLHALR